MSVYVGFRAWYSLDPTGVAVAVCDSLDGGRAFFQALPAMYTRTELFVARYEVGVGAFEVPDAEVGA